MLQRLDPGFCYLVLRDFCPPGDNRYASYDRRLTCFVEGALAKLNRKYSKAKEWGWNSNIEYSMSSIPRGSYWSQGPADVLGANTQSQDKPRTAQMLETREEQPIPQAQQAWKE